MNYHHKYLKYKSKYADLKKHLLILEQTGGVDKERYGCHPDNKFADICKIENNGKYKSKDNCINDCETKYINKQLIDANIKGETIKFYLFIKDIIQNEKIDVYIKGGNVIGINVLKMIYDKFGKDDAKFKQVFDEFLKLELIKDWDFAAYTKYKITEDYRDKLDAIAKKYKLVPRAKTFILYQTKKPILTDEKPLFEIAILDSDAYSKLELPLTTMKVKVNEYNIKYVYMFAKSFFTYKNTKEPFDFDILKRMIEKMFVKVHPHKNGLYDPEELFDKGNLNDNLIKFIDEFSGGDKKLVQFLATHLEDPFRLLYRLPEKNIPKTEKIKLFLKDELDIKKSPSWLMDTKLIEKTVEKFCTTLGKKMSDLYKKKFDESKSSSDSINLVLEFLAGVNFGRSQIEYDNFSNKNKELLKSIFNPLVKEIGVSEIKNIEENDKIITFIKFLVDKKLFDN